MPCPTCGAPLPEPADLEGRDAPDDPALDREARRRVMGEILNSVRAGSAPRAAAAAAGITMPTLRTWLNAANEDGRWFALAYRKARGAAKAEADILLMKTKPELWRTRGPGRDEVDDNVDAGSWLADRGATVTIQGPGGGPVLVGGFDPRLLSDEQLEDLDRLLTAASTATPALLEAPDAEVLARAPGGEGDA